MISFLVSLVLLCFVLFLVLFSFLLCICYFVLVSIYNLRFCLFFLFSFSLILIVVFICISLMTNDVEHLFIYLLSTCTLPISRLEGKTSWIFSSSGRCSRLIGEGRAGRGRGGTRPEPRWGGARVWEGRGRSLGGAESRSPRGAYRETRLAPMGPESLDSARERGGLEAGCRWAGGTWRGFFSECGLRDSLDVGFYFLPLCH